MNPATLGVLIPVVAIGGFFAWMIVANISKAWLQAQARSSAGLEPKQEELRTALEDLRREVAELAERVDFTERLLAKARPDEAGKLAPGDRRT
ncbi:MAG TPA: hypothetical protein VJN39_10660 [Gemmatimonadales bacterium]|nr:hypothetical protein [Gemmatimonadales bacterium]